MTRYRCNACLGEYEDRCPDGLEYYHACPPVDLIRARFDDGHDEERPLRRWAGFTIAISEQDKQERVAAGGDRATIVVELARRAAPRAGARDENTLRREGARGEIRVIRSEGRGRTAIAPLPGAPEPIEDVV